VSKPGMYWVLMRRISRVAAGGAAVMLESSITMLPPLKYTPFRDIDVKTPQETAVQGRS